MKHTTVTVISYLVIRHTVSSTFRYNCHDDKNYKPRIQNFKTKNVGKTLLSVKVWFILLSFRYILIMLKEV